MKVFLPVFGLMLALVASGCASSGGTKNSPDDAKADRKTSNNPSDKEVTADESCYYSR